MNREVRRHLTWLLGALLVLVVLIAVSTADAAPPEGGPPGQGECEHGNSEKPCKDDPQPDRGKDCDEHGQQGGVNEDHCAGEECRQEDSG